MNYQKEPLFKDLRIQSRFDRDGYVVLPFLSTDAIEYLRNLYHDKANMDLNEDFNETTRRLDPRTSKAISDAIIATFEGAGRETLQNHVVAGGTFFVKRANAETDFPMHQDWNIVDEKRYYGALLWCPLQEVTAENGAILVIPGSHTYFENTYRSGSIHPPRFPLSVFYDSKAGHILKTIDLKPGEVLVYQNNLYHGSHPNRSRHHRLVATGALLSRDAPMVYHHKPPNSGNRIEVVDASGDFFIKNIDIIVKGGLPGDAVVLETIRVKPFYPEAADLFKHAGLATTGKGASNNRSGYAIFNGGGFRHFREVYTPGNIVREIASRVGLQRKAKDTVSHPGMKVDPPGNAMENTPYDAGQANEVAAFYNSRHEKFLEVYGNVIQAFRTKNVATLLNRQLNSIGFRNGQRVLDAGCGVCAPAIHFAKSREIQIEAITISEQQYLTATEHIREQGLAPRIKVTLGDYHKLQDFYPGAFFDKVYFLESFGHSHDHETLLKSVWKVLKPGGQLYIKDLFRKVAPTASLQKTIDQEIAGINRAYRYQVADLNAFLDVSRKLGYILEFIRTIDLPLAEFEDLAISNAFQELTGIGKIDDWDTYIFPVDFFEVRLMKAQFGADKGLDRYFLQNLYRVQVENWKETDL